MSVIPLTIFFSLLLAGLFVALFAWERSRQRLGGTARDSLLPLADETPRPAVEAEHHHDEHDYAHGHTDRDHNHDHAYGHTHKHAAGARCGCRDGSRPPCVGCLRERARSGTQA